MNSVKLPLSLLTITESLLATGRRVLKRLFWHQQFQNPDDFLKCCFYSASCQCENKTLFNCLIAPLGIAHMNIQSENLNVQSLAKNNYFLWKKKGGICKIFKESFNLGYFSFKSYTFRIYFLITGWFRRGVMEEMLLNE